MTAPRMTNDVPLILLPGMGADDRLFRFQREAFPELVVPPWIAPLRRESIEGYAARMARAVDPGRPCVVGGASFGGFVAVEMLRHLNPLACVLIGSARSPACLSGAIRLSRPAASLVRLVPFELAAAAAHAAAAASGPLVRPATRSVFRQLAGADGAFLRWASEAVLRWRGTTPPAGVRIYQIHGGRDRVLPATRAAADEIIDAGGHVISLSHPTAVNDFIRKCLADVLAQRARRRTIRSVPSVPKLETRSPPVAKHTPQFLAITEDAKTRIAECTIQDMLDRRERGEKFLLVDVREDSEWAGGHIPDAVHIGKGVIERDIEVKVPDPATPLVLYCGGGFRSALAADNLQKMGYTNVISMDGGFRAWKDAGRPVEKP